MEPGPRLVYFCQCAGVCVVPCMYFLLQYVSIRECVCCLRGEPPPLSSTEVELAELMERFHVNAAKYVSLSCCDSLCRMLLLPKNTLITLLSHT